MALPQIQSPDQTMMLIQTKWASQLNPLLANKLTQGNLLQNIALINGATIINHLLDRQMQGWILVDKDASVIIYRSAALNPQTLTLTSNGAVNISLWVF